MIRLITMRFPKYLILLLVIAVIGGIVSFTKTDSSPQKWSRKSGVSEVLQQLGEPLPKHYVSIDDSAVIQRGRDILTQGWTIKANGRKSSLQSKHFKCVSCHNIRPEDPDLRHPDPENRLSYAMKKDLPFLQGSPLYGVVNRESWYNDDYLKKYGEQVVGQARDSLRAAIQLCATTCSQGRLLKDWEMEAVLAYLWSIELKLSDLDLPQQNWQRLRKALQTSETRPKLIEWFKNFYYQASPAHFGQPPSDLKKGYDVQSVSRERGAAIYALSCLHCHRPGGVARPMLDNSAMSYRFLNNRFDTYDWEKSLYVLLRKGTHPRKGDRDYMPNYTSDRLTNQQIEDLRAFIKYMDEKKSLF